MLQQLLKMFMNESVGIKMTSNNLETLTISLAWCKFCRQKPLNIWSEMCRVLHEITLIKYLMQRGSNSNSNKKKSRNETKAKALHVKVALTKIYMCSETSEV